MEKQLFMRKRRKILKLHANGRGKFLDYLKYFICVNISLVNKIYEKWWVKSDWTHHRATLVL